MMTGSSFHADWEARVYAIIRVLQRRGVINAAFDDLRDAIERIPPAEYLTPTVTPGCRGTHAAM
jgi:Nitrile hydratase beta subunit